MISVEPKQNLNPLCKFIRKDKRLTHLNLSGMLKTIKQVRLMVQCIKKADSLLAVHLSHTPIINSNRKI